MSATTGRPWVGGWLLAGVLVWAGCGTAGSGSGEDATADASEGPAPAERDSAGGEAVPAAAPPALPPLPGEGPSRDYRLLLVNPTEAEARVFARAGAERVELDTVPPRDSVRVDIRLRADAVHLAAEHPGGATLAAVRLDLSADTLTRWLIEPALPSATDSAAPPPTDSAAPPPTDSAAPPPPDTAAQAAPDPSRPSLVRPGASGYPRTGLDEGPPGGAGRARPPTSRHGGS